MIIENIKIVDFKNKKGNCFNFTEGINIITSVNNTTGKSSLLKSLYYCLGFDIQTFPDKWNYQDMIFQIQYKKNDKIGYILRIKDDFIVNGQKMILKEYSNWFRDLLEIKNFKLPTKTSDWYDVQPSIPLLPFYIDQDLSWNSVLYKNTSKNSGMFQTNFLEKIFKYLLEIENDEVITLLIQEKTLKEQKKLFNNQYNVLSELEKEFIKGDIINSICIEELTEQEVKQYLQISSNLSLEIQDCKIKIYQQQKQLDDLLLEVYEITTTKKIIEKEYKEIKHQCIKCDSFLTQEQSKRRVDLHGNLLGCEIFLIEKNNEINILKKEMENLKNNLSFAENKYLEILQNSTIEPKNVLILEKYMENNAKQKLKITYDEVKLKIVDKEKTLDKEIANIQKDIRQNNKKGKEKTKELNISFNVLIKELSSYFINIDITKYNFLKFKKIKQESGATYNEVMLCLYIIYTTILFKFSKIKLPFCVDGFIKEEIDKDNTKKFLEIIEHYVLTNNKNQIFISMLKDKLQYLKIVNFKEIEMFKDILKEEFFAELEKEFLEKLEIK